ncbi:MAG: thioredoxin [Deltaproteobacteria bacterium]|nr:thioredoxin [Deltaproteobacteria bacterium]MBW2137511.1 thioredoxin [Deltaproteobacteria bacterium]
MVENAHVPVTDEEFEKEVLKSEGLVLVDFWAKWCGPCHQMAPILESFAKANAGKVKVVKVDSDENPKAAEEYGIKSIPTLIFFKDGAPVDVNVGVISEANLQKKLDDLLGR